MGLWWDGDGSDAIGPELSRAGHIADEYRSLLGSVKSLRPGATNSAGGGLATGQERTAAIGDACARLIAFGLTCRWTAKTELLLPA